MVPPDSHGIPRVPWYSGSSPRKSLPFRLRDFHPLRLAFPDHSARVRICNFPAFARTCPTTPTCITRWFRLLPFRSPLLRESRLISFPRGTEMFHFPRFAPLRASSLNGYPGCPIRESRDHRSLAAPPGFSQLATPFFASCRLGIHCVPLSPSPLSLYPMHFSMTHPKSLFILRVATQKWIAVLIIFLLLRKEVIQAHLPVHLPCYDFAPLASLALNRPPPFGWSTHLRALPTRVA